jgi:AcrR family transcriptional regulator
MRPAFETEELARADAEPTHATPRVQVVEIQRRRVLAAAADAVAELGYARMTVAQVVARARVSRKTFYELFDDREDCFLALFSGALARGRAALATRPGEAQAWPDSVRLGLARLLALMDAEPRLARLCVVDALGGGPRVLAERARALDELAAAVDGGRAVATPGRRPGELTSEAIVGAVFAILHARLVVDAPQPLSGLLGELMSMVVLPYLGPRAARRELELARGGRVAAAAPRGAAEGDPLDGLEMRLTYRTLRVLKAIGEHPGASNRQIADRAEVADQGQISKLLARLERLGLIVNCGAGRDSGAANSWRLTSRGARLERSTRSR